MGGYPTLALERDGPHFLMKAVAGVCLIATLIASAPAAHAAERLPSERQRGEDFDVLWRAIDQGYAYFGVSRPAWKNARERFRPRAVRARSRAELIAALEGAIAQLRDDNVHLSERAADSPRRVPGETDIWAYFRDDVAVIEGIRTYGEADVAGLRPGHVIKSIGGVAPQREVRDRLGEADAPPASRDWALRHALAGPRSGVLRLETSEARGAQGFEIPRAAPTATNGPPLIGRRVGERRDLGYIRLKAPLSSPALSGQFDGALNYLKDTRALILDLRDVTGPFADAARARAITLAILGSFTSRPATWQAREPRAGERVVDTVAPRGTPYDRQLVVLVDRWTAGEGETLAAGLQAVARARVVGTRMAGLRGELREVRLPHSGITVRFPAQRTFLVDGTPRESLRPDILVDLAAPQGGPGDPILYQALKLLEPAGGQRR